MISQHLIALYVFMLYLICHSFIAHVHFLHLHLMSHVAKSCPALPEPFLNGDVTVYSMAGTYLYVGDVVDVQCDIGFHINGSTDASLTLTCLGSGLWGPEVPDCVR